MKFLLSIIFSLCGFLLINAQNADSLFVRNNYDKQIHNITMRDGINLYTIIYTPKDKSQTYPIMMYRTCYNASNLDNWNFFTFPSKFLTQEQYIFVFQDVRGRYMSDGLFDNMRPNIPGNDPNDPTAIDESSDTYDSIEWLLKNIKGHNGKVGLLGTSYPGHYALTAAIDAHPAVKAVSPQAPIADFFFDDFHHMGAFTQGYTAAFAVFGYQKDQPTKQGWYHDKIMRFYGQNVPNAYEFYLDLGPLKNLTENYHYDNFFWQQNVTHPNYDEFWQKRNILPHLKNITPAVMTVGGWFDAEDLYGPLNIYKTIEQNNPKTYNTLVMGPWGHGGWQREQGQHYHNHIYFGDSISTFYQKYIEAPFFAYHLKGKKNPKLPEAYMYDTGKKEWQQFDTWPPEDAKTYKLYFDTNGQLSINQPTNPNNIFDYISDPAKPVPYRSVIEGLVFTPRKFMTDDQRHASYRPDVLTFETDILTEDLTLAGEIMTKLKVAISTTDADFIVKLIDVYPDDHPNYDKNPKNIVMGGYQQLVRSEAFRGRFRNSFEHPEPFVSNEITAINFPLQDVLHTFKKGHQLMIQIHSTWFPYIDRNPQKYVDNIFKADEEDFVKAKIKVYGNSVIDVGGKLD